MKPAPFAYRRPETLEEALALKAAEGDGARFLAGGQSLVPAMNFRVAQPAMLIDLNRVVKLDAIEVAEDGGARIGAMVRFRRIERDPLLARHQPLLAEALAEVAHPQIRTRGTLGGNFCHADPASEMPAVMLALGARMKAVSRRGGERWIGAADFFVGTLATALTAEEMLAEIELPALPPRTGTAFQEVARRRGDYAMMGVAAVVTLDAAGRIAEARIACCSAGDTPVAGRRAAASLAGEAPGDAAFAEAAALLRAEVAPRGSVQASPAYQRHLAGVLALRALRLASERAAA
jgi:carbon-monoxide dehydrogenase medium subunit